MKPFTLNLGPTQAAKISRDGCAFTIEPMRFLLPYQAKREVNASNPNLCHHRCRIDPVDNGESGPFSMRKNQEHAKEQSMKTQEKIAA